MFTVLREPATPHPHGLTFVGAILWRGVVYGAADGVLLSVFPILAVFGLFASKPLRERSKQAVAGIGVLALVVSLLFTAVYHAGYPDFRGSKVKRPLTGDVIWSAPTLVTLSPLGTPIAHIATHVTAVVHSYTPTCSCRRTNRRNERRSPMATIKDAASEFLAHKRVAVTGVSRTPGSHGSNVVYRRLRERGYEVFAVNPNAEEVEGDRAFHDLARSLAASRRS